MVQVTTNQNFCKSKSDPLTKVQFSIVDRLVILLIRDMVVERCNKQFGRETIHPTKKITSMNLLQMSCVIT